MLLVLAKYTLVSRVRRTLHDRRDASSLSTLSGFAATLVEYGHLHMMEIDCSGWMAL